MEGGMQMDYGPIAENEHGMTVAEVKRAITPLRLVFWGALLCILDLSFSSTTNGVGFKFDILNDAVGMVMITVGVFTLSDIRVTDRYQSSMLFIKIISVLVTISAVVDHFIIPLPPPIVLFSVLLGLLSMVAIVLFCVCMRWFCIKAEMDTPARSWYVTTILFGVIYLLPLGLFYLAGGVALLTGESFYIDLGPAALLLVPVFLIPVIHLFVSTSRMKRHAESLSDVLPDGEEDHGVFPEDPTIR